jgi:hypothetical protein
VVSASDPYDRNLGFLDLNIEPIPAILKLRQAEDKAVSVTELGGSRSCKTSRLPYLIDSTLR